MKNLTSYQKWCVRAFELSKDLENDYQLVRQGLLEEGYQPRVKNLKPVTIQVMCSQGRMLAEGRKVFRGSKNKAPGTKTTSPQSVLRDVNKLLEKYKDLPIDGRRMFKNVLELVES